MIVQDAVLLPFHGARGRPQPEGGAELTALRRIPGPLAVRPSVRHAALIDDPAVRIPVEGAGAVGGVGLPIPLIAGIAAGIIADALALPLAVVEFSVVGHIAVSGVEAVELALALVEPGGKLPVVYDLPVPVDRAAALRNPGGEAAVIAQGAVLIELAPALVHVLQELAGIEDPPVGIDGAAAGAQAAVILPVINQLAFLIQPAPAAVQSLREGALIDQDSVLIGLSAAGALPVLQLALVQQHALPVVQLRLPLEHPVLQAAGEEGKGLFLIGIDDDLAAPFRHPLVFLPEPGGEEAAEDEGPHHKVDNEPQGRQEQHDADDQRLGDEQPSRFHIVRSFAGLLGGGHHPLEGGGGRLGGAAGEVRQSAELRADAHELSGKESLQRAEKHADGPDKLIQEIAQRGFLPWGRLGFWGSWAVTSA